MQRITEAVEAQVPLLKVKSTDPMHDHFVLESMFPTILPFTNINQAGNIFYREGEFDPDEEAHIYTQLEEAGKVLITINSDCPAAMDCGELKPNRMVIRDMISDIVKSGELVLISNLFDGLYVKQIKRVIAICGVRYETLTLNNLRAVKETLFFKVTGIQPISDITAYYYRESQKIDSWVWLNKDYMFADVDNRLSPKGVLLHGVPGTGKTEFSKYIARCWGIPLFLLDINAMLTKWQGEAERYLTNALVALEDEAPCVVLFDEVEKLFNNSENDTSQRLLSKILWWLQAKESKCFVVMTCNDIKAIPEELYREGRIDRVIELNGIPVKQADKFVTELLQTFEIDLKSETAKEVRKAVHSNLEPTLVNKSLKCIPQSHLSQIVIEVLKRRKFGIT